MTLYFYTQPMETSLFDIFSDDDNFFNHRLTFGHPRRTYSCRNHYIKKPYTNFERQLSKVFNNNEIFKFEDFSPKINLSEDEKNYYIHADLPGMKKEQIKMEIDENRILTISGERESLYTDSNKNDEHNETENEMEIDKIDSVKESKPEETNPDETKPKKISTEETKPDEAKSEETNPQETNPQETNPQETNPKETKSEESKPEESKSEEIKTSNERKYSRIECSYGKFERSFSIPEDGNLDCIQAKMENGVLEIIISKIEPPKHQNRVIQIQ